MKTVIGTSMFMSWIRLMTDFLSDFFHSPGRQEKIAVVVSLSVLAIYLLPLMTYGTTLHMLVYDNLDGIVPSLKILADSGKLFADSSTILPQMMGGLPRLSFGSEWRLVVWLFYFLPPFEAYAVHEILIHFVAFASMVYFLKRYIVPETCQYRTFVIYTVALAFSVIPFWPMGSLSIPLMPLAAALLLQIREGKATRLEWMLLLLIPFGSSFVVYYFFFLFLAGTVWLADLVFSRKLNAKFLMAIIAMTMMFLLVDYRLVYEMFFDSGYVSNRVEFIKTYNTFAEAYKAAHLTFLNGQPHSRSIHFPYVMVLVLFALLLSKIKTPLNAPASLSVIILGAATLVSGIWAQLLGYYYTMPVLAAAALILMAIDNDSRRFSGYFLLQIVIAYWYAFWYFEGWKSAAEHFGFLEMFHLSRFNNIQPFLWYVLLAYGMLAFIKKVRFAIPFLMLLIVFQVVLAFNHRTFQKPHNDQVVTYRNFYAVPMFERVKEYIDLPLSQYRVVSLGIYPAVSLYNGFYTLDGYMNNYPLTYAHLFEEFILQPGAYQKKIGERHPNWTSKRYIPVQGQVYYYYNKGATIDRIRMNTPLMYQHGLRYVLSGYRIQRPDQYGLKLLKKFTDSQSYWDVYLYAVREDGK